MRKPIRRESWSENESVRAKVTQADVSERSENRKVLDACVGEYGGVRLRIAWGAYGPGTEQKPTPRYWWMLGENATVTCRDADVAEWFIGELKKFIAQMDGVELEVVK